MLAAVVSYCGQSENFSSTTYWHGRWTNLWDGSATGLTSEM